MIINIGSVIVSIYLVLMLMGGIVFWSITKAEKIKAPTEKASLTLADFGHKQNASPHIDIDKSILAQRLYYYQGEGDDFLSYTVLQSKYSWVIKYDEKKLVSKLNKYGNDLKLIDTNLPKNIKVYSDSKKRSFVLVSENKVLDITKDFSEASEEEFLNKIYEKLFK